MRVIITGASGVLGSAIYHAFKKSSSDHEVLGLSFSQSIPGLQKLDLMNHDKVDETLSEFKPDWVVHCAAERRPDVAEKDPDAARKLNADLPAHLASLSQSLNFTLIYISTDYVFDGTSPPYTPSSRTNPLQLYGQTKRDGELAVLSIDRAKPVIFRVPVLYGPAPKNSDSAINILLDVVQDQSGKQYKMDHYATRYPTNTLDVADFLVRLSAVKRPLPPIIHYSSPEPFTKYEICLIFASILGLPHKHINPDADEPQGTGSASRPKDCELYCGETENLGVEGGLGCCGFEEWWREYLGKTNT